MYLGCIDFLVYNLTKLQGALDFRSIMMVVRIAFDICYATSKTGI